MENPNYYAIIPAKVRYDNELKGNEKLLYGEITALANKEGYCTATNTYFSKLYGKHKDTIQEWITRLKLKGYIETQLIKNDLGKVEERRVYPVGENAYIHRQKHPHPIGENALGNNTSINNKKEEERKIENKENDLSKITKYYEDNITLIAPTIVEEIESYLEDGIEAELIMICIKEAVDRNRRNWKYIKTILNDCYNNKVFTVKQYEIKQKEFKELKNKQYKAKTKEINKQEIKYENDFSEYDNYIRKEVQNE